MLLETRHRRLWLKSLLGLLGLSTSCVAVAQPVPTVAAASDLKFALEEVAAQFEKDTGHRLRLVFGSSGNFYSQLLQGAPFHLFMSADEGFVFKLADAGKTEGRGKLYAFGRIGIKVPKGSPLKADGQLKDLSAALKDGRLKRFAIANPEHAPYGMRAEEALRRAGLWEQISSKLVYGENVSQAAQFALSGSTQGGIIAYSLARAPALEGKGTYVLVPETLHEPLRQRMVLVRGAGSTARAFYHYLQQPAARRILDRYGFAAPAGR